VQYDLVEPKKKRDPCPSNSRSFGGEGRKSPPRGRKLSGDDDQPLPVDKLSLSLWEGRLGERLKDRGNQGGVFWGGEGGGKCRSGVLLLYLGINSNEEGDAHAVRGQGIKKRGSLGGLASGGGEEGKGGGRKRQESVNFFLFMWEI